MQSDHVNLITGSHTYDKHHQWTSPRLYFFVLYFLHPEVPHIEASPHPLYHPVSPGHHQYRQKQSHTGILLPNVQQYPNFIIHISSQSTLRETVTISFVKIIKNPDLKIIPIVIFKSGLYLFSTLSSHCNAIYTGKNGCFRLQCQYGYGWV